MKVEDLSREELQAELAALHRKVEELEAELGCPGKAADGVGKAPLGKTSDGEESPRGWNRPEALEMQEDYRSVVESASEAICITQDGLLKFVNPAGTELIGYSEEELLSKAFASLVHPEDLQELARIYMMRLRAEYVPPGHRFRIVSKAGEVKWVESWSASITWSGRPAVLSMIRDVTGHVLEEDRIRIAHDELDRRVQDRTAQLQEMNDRLMQEVSDRERAERLAKESESRLRRLMENFPIGITVTDLKRKVEYLNKKFVQLFGYTLNDMPTLDHWWRLAYPDPQNVDRIRSEWLATIRDSREKGAEPEPAEREVRCKDGTIRLIELKKTVIKQQVIHTFLDVTEIRRQEQALIESEQMFRLLSEQSLMSVAILQDGVYKYANQAMSDLCEYSLAEISNWSSEEFLRVVHPEDRSLVMEQARMKQIGDARQKIKYAFRIITRSGATKWVEIYSKTVNFKGHPANLLTMLDITDLKRAEEALRTSKAQLSDAVEMARLGHWELDVLRNEFTFNDQFYKLFRTTAAQVGGYKMPLEEYARRFVHPDEISVVGDENRKAIETDDPYFSRELEHRIVYADGEIGHISVRFFVVKDDLGRTVKTYGVNQDITQRKRAEGALKESEQRYRTLFEESIDGVYSVLRDGEITDANASFCKLFGYTREEMVGKNIRELYYDPSDRQKAQNDIEKRGFVKDYELRLVKKDGRRLDCLLTASVHWGEGGRIAGYRGIMRDVTDQKLLQRQLLHAQKMEAIGTLAGGIAHEVNNLLQVILGYSDLLLMNIEPSDPDRRKLEVVQQAARDGAELVSRILTFSRKGETNTRPLDLNEEIRKAERLLKRTLPRMVKIELILAADIGMIDADPAQLEQVILNLGVNAQHAMPNGGRLLFETSNVSLSDEQLRTHLGAKEGKYVLLTVSDTGTGMDRTVLERIFEPFFTTKPDGLGTGLGLSMVHGIVTQHGGYIKCYSEPGMGTSFKIYLPASQSQPAFDPTLTREMPAFGSETILLVDDDDRIREIGKQMLAMRGYEVLVATSGEEALEVYSLHKEEVALIVLDLIMPGMGGNRCLEELLRMDPNVKVLVTSGYSAISPSQEDTNSRARGFVSKPYDAKGILAAIRKVLDEGQL